MQTVKVKDIKVKTGVSTSGKNEGKPWELVIIIGEDGSEFTTFDTAIKEVGIGGTLELEAVIKNNKTNITKFTITQKGSVPTPSPVPGKSNGKPDMSKEDWAEKNRLEIWSRECNTCFMGLPALLVIQLSSNPKDKAVAVYDAALDWALKHFNGTPTTPMRGELEKAIQKTEADKEFDKLTSGSLGFKDAAEFAARVKKDLDIYPSGICKKMGVGKIEEIADYQAAYELLKESADK